MTKNIEIRGTQQCDILIIGAGGAGLRCAAHIAQKRPGTKVLAVTKVAHAQKSHTTTAQGGLAAVDPKDPTDKPIYHMFDTWKGSDCLADQNIIKKIVDAAWEEIIWLENHGMHFSREEDGRLSKRTFGGHTIRFGESSAFRAVFEADRTGKGIIDTVWGEAVKGGVTVFNQAVATELLFNGDRCVGAVLFKPKEGEFVRVSAKAVILASGGSGQIFQVTTNCRQNTGDLLALVMRAGLPVMDPEAVQFHPTGIVGPGILASETLRSVGGILRNKNLEAFMERYAPKMKDLAPRDLVARAIVTEIREGRGVMNEDHHLEHVWIDLTHLPEYIHDVQLPEVTGFFRKFINIDAKTELCPVCPSNHYHMGGIPTNEFGEVRKSADETVSGLFAVGECAAASFHGFNRLGTNSLLELITMGRFAGEKAMELMNEPPEDLPKDAGAKSIEQFTRYLQADGNENSVSIRQTMQKIMFHKVGVFRTEKGLMEAIEDLKGFRAQAINAPLSNKSLVMNPELTARWELENLLAVSTAVAEGALNRKESRGGHSREDYPNRSDEYQHHTLVYQSESGEVRLDRSPVDMSLYEAGGENYEKFGVIERKY